VKPSITIDERGVLLHVTDSDGNGVAVPLEPSTVLELSAALDRARTNLRTPKGRGVLLRGLAALAAEIAKK
jgi:hypothetical protein